MGRWQPGPPAERRVRPALAHRRDRVDPVNRAALFIRMNDLVIQNVVVVVVQVIIRHAVFAVANSIRGFDFTPFSGPLRRLVYWTREA